MSVEPEKPLAKNISGAERPRRPFAYRALCKVAGIVAVVSALPGLAASIQGLFALMTRPQTPAWAYALMAAIGGFAFLLIGLGSQIYRERVWAAAVTALLYGYFTFLSLTKDRLVGAAASSVTVMLCLAIVIAAWRLRSLHRAVQGGETR